ncbi:MAG: Fe-S cluster assembly ATPase SufC [Candidatus Micrarchaeia archaeon]
MDLDIIELHAYAANREIIKGLNLHIKDREVHVVMGPNGSGKTTLAKAIMGAPDIKVKGRIMLDGKDISRLAPDERAKLGLFLLFQNPPELEGVSFVSFLRSAKESIEGKEVDIKKFMSELKSDAASLKIDSELVGRQLNYKFSGGEKKKAEIVQMKILKPKLAILDEPDSGLDVDSIRDVMNSINEIKESNKIPILIITHYSRIFKYIKPEYVHILIDGRIVEEGGIELINEIDAKGFEYFADNK